MVSLCHDRHHCFLGVERWKDGFILKISGVLKTCLREVSIMQKKGKVEGAKIYCVAEDNEYLESFKKCSTG